MDCRDITDLLSAYCDGETAADETQRVEEHLADCEECRRRLADYREMDGLLAALPDITASPTFAEELNRRRQEPVHTFSLRHHKVLGIAATVAIVVTLGVVTGLSLMPGKTETTVAETFPNLGLMADEDFLGIGQYDMRASADMSSLGLESLVTDTKEGV